MTKINPPLSIIGKTQETSIYLNIPYALLEVSVVDKDLEKSGHLKCIEGSDDLDEYTISLGKADGIAFHFLRYRSRSEDKPAFVLYIDSDSFKQNNSKNFQPYVLAYRLLEQLEISWDKVIWINPELQVSLNS